MSTFTCSICHEQKPEEDQAFLDNCFHYFCLECIRRWTHVQRQAHRRDRTSASFTPHCPLCKTSYESIVFDYLDQSFRQESVAEGAAGTTLSASQAFVLTPLQRKRRSLYFLPTSAQPKRDLPFKVATAWQQLVGRPEVAKWLERELQALLLQPDVTLIHTVVTAAMQSAPQEEEAWCQAVERETAAFLGDKAPQFARELRMFVGSGMTVRNYDRHTEATGPDNAGGQQPSLPSTFEGRPSPNPDQASGSESARASSSEQGGVAESDSEGYDDLLLNAARRTSATAAPAGLTQDTKKRRKKHKSTKKERRKRHRKERDSRPQVEGREGGKLPTTD